jgi:hypothetical protein
MSNLDAPKIIAFKPIKGVSKNLREAKSPRPSAGKPYGDGDICAIVERMWANHSVPQIAKTVSEITGQRYSARAIWNIRAALDSYWRKAEKD